MTSFESTRALSPDLITESFTRKEKIPVNLLPLLTAIHLVDPSPPLPLPRDDFSQINKKKTLPLTPLKHDPETGDALQNPRLPQQQQHRRQRLISLL